jgi:DNA-binding protein YbaB
MMKEISKLFLVVVVVVLIMSINNKCLGFGFGGLTPLGTSKQSSSLGIVVMGRTGYSRNSSTSSSTSRFMFGGSGISPLEEDDDLNVAVDPEKESQLEATAKAMGITVKEYKLILKSQETMQKALNSLRVSGGNSATVMVELDGNSPPKHLKVSVTEDGKALGKATLEKELVSALKQAGEAAKKGQADVMRQMQEDIAKAYKAM